MNSIGSGNPLSSPGNASPVTAATSPHGEAFGGQQPVSGMSLQLYAAKAAAAMAPAATGLFAASVPPRVRAEAFSFPAYTCPTPSTQVYLVGTGGDPTAGNTGGNTAANPNLALMVALGSCSSLNSGTRIHMNELTTVAAVWALAPFMSGSTTSYLNVGSTSTNAHWTATCCALKHRAKRWPTTSDWRYVPRQPSGGRHAADI